MGTKHFAISFVIAASTVASVAACTLGTPLGQPGGGTGVEGEGEGGGEGEGVAATSACGVLQTKCVSCHAPGGFVPDLSVGVLQAGTLVGAHSAAYPSETYVVSGDPSSSFLMKKIAGTQPTSEGVQMPSGAPALSATDQALVSSWIQNGAPGTDCDGTTAPDPIAEATGGGLFASGGGASCTSNQHYVAGNDGDGGMYPGQDCIACHQQTGGEAPIDALMGTVFLGAHDADDCRGLAPTNYSAFVDVLSPDGSLLFTMDVDSSGNFRSSGQSPGGSYRAQVRLVDGTGATIATSTMQTAQTVGSCNSCHTSSANGPVASDVPLGRITIAP